MLGSLFVLDRMNTEDETNFGSRVDGTGTE